MADGQVVFEISADPTKAKNAINQTTKALEQAGKDWEDSAEGSTAKIGGSFADMFKKIGIAAAAAKIGKFFLDFGKAAVDAASDLEEVQNVVDVTFGDGASQIQAWANTARTQFGLTEIQAKKFTSTLGAMMKSAGLAGPEIVSMSTDLAGLAADMASFYNLDFETAFQKIRSGISGETEPLKQLGINMSVANLEAYALSKGIETAFDKMSQSEQTMLRYQYLMQATADAQGDFARTSDGYANTIRSIETSFESIKTSIGTVLLPAVADAAREIQGLIELMIPDPDFRTVLDEFNDIEVDTQAKLAKIEETRSQALALVELLDQLSGHSALEGTEAAFVSKIAQSIDELSTATDYAKSRDAAGTVKSIFDTFNQEKTTLGNADAWNNLLASLSANVESVAEVTGKDPTEIKDWLSGVATAANDLNIDSVSGWIELMTMLTEGIPGLEIGDGFTLDATGISKYFNDISGPLGTLNTEVGKAKSTGYKTTLQGIFQAFNSDIAKGDNVTAWDTLLSSLAANIGALSEYTGETPEALEAWLQGMGDAANTLNPDSAEGWAELMGMLREGLPGLEFDEDGTIDTSVIMQAGEKANQYTEYLAALGFETDNIVDSQQLWLNLCRQLIQVMPGLSSIIDMNTGEVEGGSQALRTYIEDWYNAETKMAYLQDLQRRRQALDTAYEQQYQLLGAASVARSASDRLEREFQAAMEAGNFTEKDVLDRMTSRDVQPLWNPWADAIDEAIQPYTELLKAREEASKAEQQYTQYREDYITAVKQLEEEEAAVNERFGEGTAAMTEAADAANDVATVDEKLATEILPNLESALAAVADYYEDVYNATERQVDGVIKGFEKMQTPAQKAREEFRKLNNELSDEEFEIRFADEGNVPSAQSMLAGLESQAEYIRQYQEYLEAARALGVDEGLLAELSDGSTESYDYLAALAGATDTEIEKINAAYADVSEGKDTFVDALTQQKLAADQTFQGIVASADAMVEQLDLADEVYDAMEATVQGMANGIASQYDNLKSQVDAVIAQVTRLNNIGHFGMSNDRFVFGASGRLLDGSFAGGADYIPFDGFLAQLHEGESVLTAEEARVWRTFKYGAAASSNNIDYDALGSTIGANVHAGGSVYLDGAVVGRVISNGQANAYRQLERSGWQK